MNGNLVNPTMSPSNLIIDGEIEFSVHPSNHLLPSPCITSKRTHYLLLNHLFPFLMNSTSTQKNTA